ncbi:hypothetical protein N1030_09305 [Desulfovibrio mangrovi]|uniref:hypothetical protein n=1 Tax=Desulfovibrio mangrovi TaxID=2976983 RepID=UPI002247ED98|nr:hypothetical protein [Desulfovibrio mangrovi]UZP65827.1 hypothetical protein N1030_09305 [Desulfovibrio mangrovi]
MLHLLLFQRDCVGCGYCCVKSQCIPGQQRYGEQGVCAGLYWNGTCYRCRLIDESPDVAAVLQVGEGCCRPLNRWRRDVWQRVRTPVDTPPPVTAVSVSMTDALSHERQDRQAGQGDQRERKSD